MREIPVKSEDPMFVLNYELTLKCLFIGLGGLIAQRLEEQLFRWLRAAELTCDRAALLVAQDPKVLDHNIFLVSNRELMLQDILTSWISFLFMYLQEVVVSVLMKLAGGSPSLADQLNVDAFLEQARSYDQASSTPVGWYIR